MSNKKEFAEWSKEKADITLTNLQVFTIISLCTQERIRLKEKIGKEKEGGWVEDAEFHESQLRDVVDLLKTITNPPKVSEHKYVLTRQDSLNDVQEIYILNTEEEAVAKMEEEFKSTLEWLKWYGGFEDGDFEQEDGQWYHNLIVKSRPDDYTYLWSIHISDN